MWICSLTIIFKSVRRDRRVNIQETDYLAKSGGRTHGENRLLWKFGRAFLPFGIFTNGIFTIWHFYQCHFYHLAFLLLALLLSGIFTTGIFTIWHIYQWHFYHLAYLLMAFLPSGIFTNGIFTIWHFHQWHFCLWESYLWHFYQWHFYLHPWRYEREHRSTKSRKSGHLFWYDLVPLVIVPFFLPNSQCWGGM